MYTYYLILRLTLPFKLPKIIVKVENQRVANFIIIIIHVHVIAIHYYYSLFHENRFLRSWRLLIKNFFSISNNCNGYK